MPKFNVERSIVIDASADAIVDVLTDFKQWPVWSPWLITEPDAELIYSDDGADDDKTNTNAWYQWSGNVVGSGRMNIVSATAHQIDYHLQFFKPFKSKADVTFGLQPEDTATRVSWRMNSQLPFFMFFMVEKMKAWIGMDYERGLKMLKDYIETGTVPSELDMDKHATLDGTDYIGIRGSEHIASLGEVMPGHFQSLYDFARAHDLNTDIVPFAIYESMDVVSGNMDFISAAPVDSSFQGDLPSPFIQGHLSGGDALKVTHTGKYDHLGNAWSMGMGTARANKIKIQKKPMGIERYINDPQHTAPEALITEVVFLKK